MARVRHGEAAPKKKRASKKKATAKKVAKKKAAKKAGGVRARRAMKRSAAEQAAAIPAGEKAPRSQAAGVMDAPIMEVEGEHPVDTIQRETRKARRTSGKSGPVRLRTQLDEYRSDFRKGPLDERTIEEIRTQLEFGLFRTTTERLLGLSPGRIGRWIRRGKDNRDEIEAWHDRVDELIEGGMTPEAAVAEVGEEPELNNYGLLHAVVLAAEAKGERNCVAGVLNKAADGDWRAYAWLLTRRYNKRYGEHQTKSPVEEEDQVWSGEKSKKSATERLADTLEEMFGRRAAVDKLVEDEENMP